MKFATKNETPLNAFLEEKAEQQKAAWTAEYEEKVRLDKIAESKAAEKATEDAALMERINRNMQTQSRQYVSPQSTHELCHVCHEERLRTAVCHTTKNGSVCMCNPRGCLSCGRISADTYHSLTQAERDNGYLVENAALGVAAVVDKVDLAHNEANALLNNVIDPVLRQRQR
jgi:excinuclease UvrABC ATPase subunit